MIDLKKESRNLLFGILLVVALIFIIRFFHLIHWQIVILLCCSTTIFTLVEYFKTKLFSVWKLIKNFCWIAGFVYFFYFLHYFGYGGYFIGIGVVVFLMLFRRRKRFIEVKHMIEERIWGKPLKEFVKEGKKPPKIEIAWK